MRLDEAPGGEAHRDLDASAADLAPEAAPGDFAEQQLSGPAGGAVDWSRAGAGGDFEGEGDPLETRLSGPPSLREHLQGQLALAGFDPARRVIAAQLLDAVDEAGYLRADLAETANRLGCAPAEVEAVLARLQGFEPTGVFARDLKERLALQLKERDRLDPAMAVLLDNLELLARRDVLALRRLCGVDDEDLREMIAEVKSLNPRPCAGFEADASPPVVPDIFVREDAQGAWRVELNTDTLPRVLVDHSYQARIARGARTEADRAFVSDCVASANWLVRSLDQRARTILKVTSEIVRQQDAFLAYGVAHLRPLNLKQVAEAIGMHESTVSRVTSNKYMATPRGVFELKFFFTSAIAATDGREAHSAESVRHRIKRLIDGEHETSEGVLSDDRIVEILKGSGVDIARRTVAKYREALRIPSSLERRRTMRAAV